MARITCAISGIRFQCSYLDDLNIPHTQGYFHPIFACSYTQLHHLYSKHTKGHLTPKDSYLLFMAFLHSSSKVEWKHPATLNPNEASTKKFIENNIRQLVVVLEKTGVIRHPSFSQPNFVLTYENCNLQQIPNWIKAWENNIESFKCGRSSLREQEDLQKVENRLSKLIFSGEKPENYSSTIAEWACKAADFPVHKQELWKKTIRSCFSITKMFNTPLPLLKEIKDFCECNIEAGSIHFHTLSQVLREGIFRHIDYLGGSNLALGYTLLATPSSKSPSGISRQETELKGQAELAALKAKAPSSPPEQANYESKLEFIRAKLAYRVALTIIKQEEEES